MKNNYILGAGPAGLIAAYYLKDYQIIDKNPLGQLNLPFIPGPRLLQASNNMIHLAKELFPEEEIKIEIASIGYHIKNEIGDSEMLDTPTEEFKQKYIETTRGLGVKEDSHLSGGMTEIKHVEIGDNGEDSYKIFFIKILKIIKSRKQIIDLKVHKIYTDKKIIVFDKGGCNCKGNIKYIESKYENLISTLNLNILSKLCPNVEMYIHKAHLDLSTTNKCFYQIKYGFNVKEALLKNHPSIMYDYVYSINTEWTRQTFFRDYIVYESVKPIQNCLKNKKVINKFENMPIQIKKSLDIDSIKDIKMLGRFAQWSHKMKANEVLDKVKKWID